jgi:transcriptional regulator with XRE-family HTH domain
MNKKLGEFIRAHRERIKPQAVGIPHIGRRRTPGLRREELAQLCAVSPTWLTWLEQGRPVSASAKVLEKIADVMQFSSAERAYLFRLADKVDTKVQAAQPEPDKVLMDVVHAIKTPAYILNLQWDAVAWNRAAKELFVGWLDQATTPNLLRFIFLNNSAKKFIVDWPKRAERSVAEFRADTGKFDQVQVKILVDELLKKSRDFRHYWSQQNVVGRDGGERQFTHPNNGKLIFNQVTFRLATEHDLKLVVLLKK